VVSRLYDAYLGSVGDIMRMGVAARLKVYLLTLAANVYFAEFEGRRFDRLNSGAGSESRAVEIILPSRVSFKGAAAKLYDLLPQRLHGLLTRCLYWAMWWTTRSMKRRTAAEWHALPEDMQTALDGPHGDIARLSAYLRQAHDRPRAHLQ
jgi:hypothetical protein